MQMRPFRAGITFMRVGHECYLVGAGTTCIAERDIERCTALTVAMTRSHRVARSCADTGWDRSSAL